VEKFEREQYSRPNGLDMSDLLDSIGRHLAVIEANHATKADILDAKHSIIRWSVSTVLLAHLIPALLKALAC
jgi:putative NIF3 family GTP cyclohydrolase 1 type 2